MSKKNGCSLFLALNAIHTQTFGECRLFFKTTWGFSYAHMTQLWRLTAPSSLKYASSDHTIFSKLFSLSCINRAKFILAVLSVSVISLQRVILYGCTPKERTIRATLLLKQLKWKHDHECSLIAIAPENLQRLVCGLTIVTVSQMERCLVMILLIRIFN